MNKLLNSALVASALITLPTTAFAATLNYNFSMQVTNIQDPTYGVFDDLSVGDSLSFSVQLDSKATGDGHAVIKVGEISVKSTGSWASSWSDVQYNGSNLVWDAYIGSTSEKLLVNGVLIGHGVSYHQELYLDFSSLASGNYQLSSGSFEMRVQNSSNAKIQAKYVAPTAPQPPKPPVAAQVPELDGQAGSHAAVLLGGAAVVFLSSRRRVLKPE